MRKLIAAAALAASLVGVLGVSPAGAKTKVPKACLAALDDAEDIVGVSSDVLAAIGAYFGTLSDSSSKPTILFLADMNTATSTFSAEITDANDRVTPMIASYNANAAKCRAKK